MRIIYDLEYDLDAWLEEMRRCRGEIVNPHVVEHAPEPEPDFEAMRNLLTGDASE